MNYKRIYDKLVTGKSTRVKDVHTYYESHHIIPRVLGGGNEKSNLVLLTAREHFIAHRLLSKIHPKILGLKLAVLFMASVDRYDYKVNSRSYQNLKIGISKEREL